MHNTCFLLSRIPSKCTLMAFAESECLRGTGMQSSYSLLPFPYVTYSETGIGFRIEVGMNENCGNLAFNRRQQQRRTEMRGQKQGHAGLATLGTCETKQQRNGHKWALQGSENNDVCQDGDSDARNHHDCWHF